MESKVNREGPSQPEGREQERMSAEAVCPTKKELLYQISGTTSGKKQLTRYDFDAALAALDSGDAPEYWRSLEELAGTKEFQEQLHREFPKGASEWLDPVSRRGFLKLMGASVALAGLTGCIRQPIEPIVPYVRQPDNQVFGKPLFYATAMTLSGYGRPLLVRSNEGRPSKVDGNPEHPVSMGAADIFSQGSLLDLYDPDRLQTMMYEGEIRTWPSFLGGVRGQIAAQQAVQGAGVRLLTETVSSPTLAAQIRGVLQRFPGAKWYQWDPVNRDHIRAGAQMAFGQYVQTHYRLTEADVIVSLDANFLSPEFTGFTKYAREFSSRRRPEANPAARPFTTANYTALPDRPMNRFYSIESTPTNTGAKADHHVPVKFGDVEKYARILATAVGVSAGGGNANSDFDAKVLAAAAKDLQAHRGTSVIIAGEQQPAVVHALAHAMNEALGNVGKTVFYTEPVIANPTDQVAGMKELASDMWAGKVDMIVITGANPVYDAPVDLNFLGALLKVPLRIYHGTHGNETAANCSWVVNGTHYMEEWSDVRAVDGSVCFVQPLTAPLYGGKSVHELLNAFGAEPELSGYDTVRGYWQSQIKGADFESWWQKSVHDGFVANSAFAPLNIRVKQTSFAAPAQGAATNTVGAVELIFRPDPCVYDGRFANNAWLQELHKPMTKVVWDNPLMVSPRTAVRLDLDQEDVVEIHNAGQKVEAAVWIQPGHPDDSVTMFLGYGRGRAGRAGTGLGFNAYRIRPTTELNAVHGVTLNKTGRTYPLITTQGFQSMEGRDIVRGTTLQKYREDPLFAVRLEREPDPAETLYPIYDYTGYAWGMAIDQNTCIGCNACVIACQSENNVPVVGKLEVARGRHMHWLRVDTYYQGGLSNPRVYFQPVPCMHCETAPCELVCPVAATVHGTEGLNEMIYNRCVGTRYCSNNCPYKVRRFNFLLFQDWNMPQYKMMRNPEVTIRSRGVMEKCTYCIQRIQQARMEAEKENHLIRDGSLQTACQQVCPSDAIVFGNINDKNSRVVKLKENPRNYGLLADLNTRPRTTYLAVVTNPNPDLAEAEKPDHA